MQYIVGHIKSLLYHLIGSAGPKMNDLGFEPAAASPVAIRDFKAQELKLFPYSTDISTTPPESDSYVKIKANFSGVKPQEFFIVDQGLPTQDEAYCNVSPFWTAVRASKDATALQFTTHTLEVRLAINGQKSTTKGEQKFVRLNQHEVKSKTSPSKVTISVPYVLNTTYIACGTYVKAASSPHLVVNRG